MEVNEEDMVEYKKGKELENTMTSLESQIHSLKGIDRFMSSTITTGAVFISGVGIYAGVHEVTFAGILMTLTMGSYCMTTYRLPKKLSSQLEETKKEYDNLSENYQSFDNLLNPKKTLVETPKALVKTPKETSIVKKALTTILG